MPKINWVGNKPWDTEFPEYPIPEHAKVLKRPENIFVACLPYGILPLLFSYGVIVLKWYVLSSKEVDPWLIPVGIIIGILLAPAHEYLHAICYPRGSTVYIGVSMEKFAAFAACNEPLSRKRFIVVSLMPMMLGMVPLLVFLACPSSPILNSICIPAGIIGMLSPMPDYMDVYLVYRQVPKGAMIQSSNNGIYWYKKERGASDPQS